MSGTNSQNSSIFTKFFLYLSFFVLIIAVLCSQSIWIFRFKPLDAKFIEYPRIIPLEGDLEKNHFLEDASYIAHKKLRGPETIVFSNNGTMYSGLLNGQVVRIDPETNEIFKIAQIGDETNETICNDYGVNIYAHESCGRPLGLRFKPNDQNVLYVADAYYGIIKIDLITGFKKQVLSTSDDRFENMPVKMINDLDIDGDLIYFIDSSYRRDINEALEEAVEAQPRGKLFSYNERTDELELLSEYLFFPNGLQLMPNKAEILINECSASRILKYYLKGEKKGTKEIFADIPGLGDTIRFSDHDTLLVPIAVLRRSKYTSVMDLLGKYPKIRSFLFSILNIRQIMLSYSILPKYGLLIEYDLKGKVVKSWHDPTGKIISGTASAAIFNKKIYIGSYYSDFIATVDY